MKLGPITITIAILASALACSGKKDPSKKDNGTTEPVAQAKRDAAAAKALDAGMGTSGRHRDQQGWVPAEFKTGKAKWKESGVYVDGECLGMLTFPELPRNLKPRWGGDDTPGDPSTQRFGMLDYLEATGIDVKKVKELHVYGGRLHVVRITGADARKYRKDLIFRFGTGTGGKTLVIFPTQLKINTTFDKLTAIVAYVDKKAPTLNPDTEHVELDGKRVWKIPYFGDPLRGGVRVYRDDRMVLHLKRNKLEESEGIAEWTADKKELRWKLVPFLKKYGVGMKGVNSAQVIRHGARQETLDRKTLDNAYFTAIPQSSGKIRVDGNIEVQALSLYSTAKPPAGKSIPPKDKAEPTKGKAFPPKP